MFQIVDSNNNVVMISPTIGGAKRVANVRSKKEPKDSFSVLTPEDKFVVKYVDGKAQ